MSTFQKYQVPILILVLLVGGFIVYSNFFASTPAPALSATAGSQDATVDQDLISLLLTLKSIKLDDSIFADPAFKSLQDFSRDLVPEPVGRTNPFAPLGSVGNPGGK